MSAKTVTAIRIDLKDSQIAVKTRWDELKSRTGLTNVQLIAELLNAYESDIHQPSIEFSENELSTINQAVGISGESFDSLLKESMLSACKSIVKQWESVQDGNLGTRKGSAVYRIERAIEAVKTHNSQCNEGCEYFITPTLIRSLVGTNYPVLRKYFEMHESEISEYHESMGLTKSCNKKHNGSSAIDVLKPLLSDIL